MNERIQWRDVPKLEAALTLFLLILTVNMIVASLWYPWFMVIVSIPAFLFGMWARVTWNDTQENRELRLYLTKLKSDKFWYEYTAKMYSALHQRTVERVLGGDDE